MTNYASNLHLSLWDRSGSLRNCIPFSVAVYIRHISEGNFDVLDFYESVAIVYKIRLVLLISLSYSAKLTFKNFTYDDQDVLVSSCNFV